MAAFFFRRPAGAIRRRIPACVANTATPAWGVAMLRPFQPAPGHAVIKSLLFVLRIAIAWFLVVLLASAVWNNIPLLGRLDWPITIAGLITMALVVAGALSHLARVQLIAGSNDKAALANRQRRQIEIPLEAGEAFDLLDAAIRELPRIEQVESARDSL